MLVTFIYQLLAAIGPTGSHLVGFVDRESSLIIIYFYPKCEKPGYVRGCMSLYLESQLLEESKGDGQAHLEATVSQDLTFL